MKEVRLSQKADRSSLTCIESFKDQGAHSGQSLERSVAVGQFGKHRHELVEVDQSVAVNVDLCNDFCPDFVIGHHIFPKDVGNLLSFNCATSVFVKKAKGCLHVLLVEQRGLVDRSSAPLPEIDRTTAIRVGVNEDLLSTLLDNTILRVRKQPFVAADELVLLDETVAVLVPLLKRLLQLLLLPPRGQVARHESHSRLLELRFVLHTRAELRVAETNRYLL